nr:hypothetical protein GlirM_p28 [Rhizophagus irregularis]ADM94803.1 hypothetical protein [Rhizophagus irregularis]
MASWILAWFWDNREIMDSRLSTLLSKGVTWALINSLTWTRDTTGASAGVCDTGGCDDCCDGVGNWTGEPPSCVITTLTRPCTKGAQFIFDNEDRMSAYCTNELSDISAFLEGRKLHQDRSSKFKEGTEIYSDELGKVKGIKEYIIHIGIQWSVWNSNGSWCVEGILHIF